MSRFDDDPRIAQAHALRLRANEPGTPEPAVRRWRRRAHRLEHEALADLLAPKIGAPAELPADAQTSLF